VILASEAFIASTCIISAPDRTWVGCTPFNAWVLLKGLETLALRVRAQTDTAGQIRGCARQTSERSPD